MQTTRRRFRDHTAPTMGKGLSALAAKGRAGDTEVGHLTPGEVVVPRRVWQADPALRQRATAAMQQAGLNPQQFIVGHPQNSKNPQTGAREFADLMYTDRGWVNAANPSQAADFSQADYGFGATNQPQPMSAAPPDPRSDGPRPDAPTRESAYVGPNGQTGAQVLSNVGTGWTDADYAARARDWGADAAVNQQLAGATNFTGDFGSGGFSAYMDTASQAERDAAARILQEQGRAGRIDWGTGGSPDRDFGTDANAEVNQGLANVTGYTGNFGDGGFNSYISTAPQEVRDRAGSWLSSNNQSNRINWDFSGGASGNDGFADEQPYLDGTIPPGSFTPIAPPDNGLQPMGDGFLQYDFGAGQANIKNLVDYYNTYGVIPAGTRFDTQANNTTGLFMPPTGKPVDSSWEAMANLTPEQWASLTRSIGVDPNDPNAWLHVENTFGLGRQVEDPNWKGGARDQPIFDANGNYVGLTGRMNEADAFERGVVTLGTWPNQVDVPMADILSGKVNVNSVEMALSAGYDPQGFEGSTNTLDAAAQIFRGMPGLDRTPLNSAEFNTLRKPLEAATPGFWQQVENRTARQAGQGRTIPNELRGSSDLNAILGGNTTYSSTNGGALTGNRVGASAPPPVGGANGTGTGGPLDYSRNDAGWDRGSQVITMGAGGNFSIWRHPDGRIYHSDANGEYELIPQANGLYLDSLNGLLRNSQGIIVNPDGTPMVTDFSRSYYGNAGTTDAMRLLGSTDLNARLGSYKGVDLTTLRDGNNTPVRGNYGGTGRVSTAPITGQTGGGTNTGGGTTNTNTGSNGTTQTGTGLTPGTTNPYSLPLGINLNIFGNGQQQQGTGTGTGTQTQSDPWSWLSLLNLGYGSSAYGNPTYTSQDQSGGGINYVQPNSQSVEFRSPFGY